MAVTVPTGSLTVTRAISDAGFGRDAGANVEVVTKSGTNQFHGGVFEFFRNTVLDANDTFLKGAGQARPIMQQNQFGGVIGGPIKKNKLFFFGGYQGTLVRSAPPESFGYVPTAAMLAGDFTAFASPACNAGRQLTLSAAQGFVNNQISPALFRVAR